METIELSNVSQSMAIGQALQFWECWRRNGNHLPEHQELGVSVLKDNLRIKYVEYIKTWNELSGEPMEERVMDYKFINLTQYDTMEKFTDAIENVFDFLAEHTIEFKPKK
jgi:hypothetical protein